MKRIELNFSDIDPTIIDFESGDWTWGRGGHPLGNDERYISHIAADMTETRYKLPACINTLVETERRWAAEEVQRNIKAALGI